jgi:hypothetical protein
MDEATCTIIKVEDAATLDDVAARVYAAAGDPRRGLFTAINRPALTGPQLRAGRSLVVPLSTRFSPGDTANAVGIARQLATRPPVQSPLQSRRMVEDFSLMEAVSRAPDTLDFLENEVSGVEDYLKGRTAGIKRQLRALDAVYRKAMTEGVALNSQKFRDMRAPIDDALKAQINGMARDQVMVKMRGSASKSLGISHKSIQTAFKAQGSAFQIDGITKALKRTDRLAARVDMMKFVGRPLTVLDWGADLREGYRADGAMGVSQAAAKKATGVLVGRGVSMGATAALLAFGVGTGGTGFVVLGIVAVAGQMLGQEVGEGLYEMTANSAATWIAR